MASDRTRRPARPDGALPAVAAMIGDPGGIGPEVCVKAVLHGGLHASCRPYLIGSAEVVRHVARSLGSDGAVEVVADVDLDVDSGRPDVLQVIDPGGYDFERFAVGVPSANAGRAVVDWIRHGESLGRSGRIDGLVLGPVDSASLKLDGQLADIDALQPAGTFMLRISGKLRVVPLTEHIPLREVPASVTPERVLALVSLLHDRLLAWGIERPKIAVAGLNPHAMFEDDRLQVLPAVEAARAQGLRVEGPVSPDSVFRMALEGKFDAVVSLYHDQGQIAVKTAAFAGACTVYMGLPFVMLNVPHGTAFDIAGKGIAQSRSIESAFRTAAALARGHGFLQS